MPLIAKDGSGDDFEKTPTGTHIARCYQVVAIGTHKFVYQGKEKSNFQVIIGWELPTKLMTEGDFAGQPFAVSGIYTLSLADKSNLGPLLVSWRGRSFTDEEKKGFDVFKLLGVPCMANVVHEKAKTSDKINAKISSVMGLPENTTCPEAINHPVSFELDVNNFAQATFDVLPKWIQKLIMSSEEYQSMGQPAQEAPDFGGPDMPEDVPF